jgi:hypothetical protein
MVALARAVKDPAGTVLVDAHRVCTGYVLIRCAPTSRRDVDALAGQAQSALSGPPVSLRVCDAGTGTRIGLSIDAG